MARLLSRSAEIALYTPNGHVRAILDGVWRHTTDALSGSRGLSGTPGWGSLPVLRDIAVWRSRIYPVFVFSGGFRSLDTFPMIAKQLLYTRGRAVAHAAPHDQRRRAKGLGEKLEVCVLRRHRKPMLASVSNQDIVVRFVEVKVLDVS